MFTRTAIIKSIGVIISYLGLLIAAWFFSADVMIIFISFWIELVILILAYVIVAFSSGKGETGTNVLVASPFFIMIQYVLIGLIEMNLVEDPQFMMSFRGLARTEIIIMAATMMVLYGIRLLKIQDKTHREYYAQDNVLGQSLSLLALNVLALVYVTIFDSHSAGAVLSIVVAGRIAIEIYSLESKGLKKVNQR